VLQLLVTANVAPNSRILSTLMMEAIRSSETPVPTGTTRRNIPRDGILQKQNCYNVTGKPYALLRANKAIKPNLCQILSMVIVSYIYDVINKIIIFLSQIKKKEEYDVISSTASLSKSR
jgi:hypothetical protein